MVKKITCLTRSLYAKASTNFIASLEQVYKLGINALKSACMVLTESILLLEMIAICIWLTKVKC